MGKGNKGTAGKKAGGKADEDFDQFLKDLKSVTAEQAKVRKAEVPDVMTADQRRQLHKQKQEENERKKQADVEAAIQQQQRQAQLRELIANMMRGPFGTKANKEFTGETVNGKHYDAASGAMQGWRSAMEDAHVTLPDFKQADKAGLFGVFDGHGGAKCAALCKAVLPITASQDYDAKTKSIDFNGMYHHLDKALRDKLRETSGCTAVVVLINDKEVTCANVGDSRAVLCRAGKAHNLSEDHKPENPEERARIEAAGGHVADNRVNGQLAMSRALGDFQYKGNEKLAVDQQLVVPIPEVISIPRAADDEFLVIACDGIFDVLTNQEVVDFVRPELAAGTPLQEICHKMCLHCLAPEEDGRPSRAVGTDNMTVTIVKIKKN